MKICRARLIGVKAGSAKHRVKTPKMGNHGFFYKNHFLLIGLIVLSLGILGLSAFLGFDEGDNYYGYWEKPNWYLFPLYWLALIPLVHFSWVPFMDAWEDLFRTGVARADKNYNFSDFERFRNIADKSKIIMIIVSILIAAYLNHKDSCDVFKNHFIDYKKFREIPGGYRGGGL